MDRTKILCCGPNLRFYHLIEVAINIWQSAEKYNELTNNTFKRVSLEYCNYSKLEIAITEH